eukprot:gene9610-11232_t
MSLISFGSRPRLAREPLLRLSADEPPTPPPPMPCRWAMACSTGPPGAAWWE